MAFGAGSEFPPTSLRNQKGRIGHYQVPPFFILHTLKMEGMNQYPAYLYKSALLRLNLYKTLSLHSFEPNHTQYTLLFIMSAIRVIAVFTGIIAVSTIVNTVISTVLGLLDVLTPGLTLRRRSRGQYISPDLEEGRLERHPSHLNRWRFWPFRHRTQTEPSFLYDQKQ